MKRFVMVLGFLIVAVIAAQMDDNVNPEVLRFIEMTQSTEDTPAFFYLLGIPANEAASPEAVGRAIYENIKEAPDNYRYDTEVHLDNKLSLPSDGAICHLTAPDCIQKITSNASTFANDVKTHAVLIDRYTTFMAYERYVTLTEPNINEVTPSFQYILKANRLVLGDLLISDSPHRFHRLVVNIEQIRKRLSDADTVISKMVYLNMLEESLNVMALMVSSHTMNRFIQITPLTKQERSLARPIAREFHLLFNSYQYEIDTTRIFSSTADEVSNPKWIGTMLYKPNITINALFPVYKKKAENSELTAIEFRDREELTVQDKSWVRNPIGTILNDIAMPNYDEYSHQFFEVDNQIMAINQAITAMEPHNDY